VNVQTFDTKTLRRQKRVLANKWRLTFFRSGSYSSGSYWNSLFESTIWL